MKILTISKIIIPFALAIAIAGCGNEKAEKKQPEEASAPGIVKLSRASMKEIGLTTQPVSRKPFAKMLVIPAKVLANQDNEALVGSLVQGRVYRVFAKAGDYVKAGQKLMLVEGVEIGEIKARFLSAKANLEYQKSNYERQKKLLEQNIGAQKTFLETQNEFEKAKAEYNAEKSRLSAIGLTENEVIDGEGRPTDENGSGTLTIKSPINGIIVERNVVIGQFIEAATTAFRIINLNSVWVDGQIYEKDAYKINNRTAVDFIVSSVPETSFKGFVTYIGQMIDEKTRTITIRAEFENAAGKLKPQMFGELRISGKSNSMAILVPAEAIVKIDAADYVFVQKSDSVFDKTQVSVCCLQNETVEIVKGLKEGDRIAVKGAFYLKSELLKASLGEGE